jgi:hypothetical protein
MYRPSKSVAVPFLRGLHHDARYNGLLAKIGLPMQL